THRCARAVLRFDHVHQGPGELADADQCGSGDPALGRVIVVRSLLCAAATTCLLACLATSARAQANDRFEISFSPNVRIAESASVPSGQTQRRVGFSAEFALSRP